MKFRSLRNSFAAAFLALATSALLSSCGGGAAPTSNGGTLQILPSGGTVYAGVPFEFQIVGEQPPYTLSSDQPGIVTVPNQINSHSLTIVAQNPGVIDVGLDPNAVPSRTVNITVRSAVGNSTVATMNVAQNFFTAYGVSFAVNTCAAASATTTTTQACAGGQTTVRLQAAINGALFAGRQYQFQVLQGPFQWLFPNGTIAGNTVTVTTDGTGTATAIMQVNPGVATQVAVLRVLDVATGTYQDTAFVIQGATTNGQLTVIPDTFTFTGALSTQCGTGEATFFVFDGSPPYTAASSSTSIFLVNTTSSSNPGQFRFAVTDPNTCLSDATIVVTDSIGGRGTATVSTALGSFTPPPPPPLTVAPTSITLGCASSGSVTAVGGTGRYSTNSTAPEITATVSGSTITITRAGPAGPGSGTLNATVSVTDGATIVPIAVTAPATCP